MAIAYDTSAVSSQYGSTSSPLSMSCGITIGAGSDNYAFVDIIDTNLGSQNFVPNSTTPPVVTLGGVTLASLGWVLLNNSAAGGFVWRFGGAGVLTGAQTASVSLTDAGHVTVDTFVLVTTYTGVGSVGVLQTAAGTFSPSVPVSSAAGRVVSGVIASYSTACTLSSPSFTSRQNQSALDPPFIAGDMAGAGSVAFSAAQSAAGYPWGAVAIDMLPVGAAPAPSNKFFAIL